MKVTLRALRVNSSLTIEEASKKLDIGKETLRNYENNKTSPDQKTLNKILKLYQVNYEDVLFSNDCNIETLPSFKQKKDRKEKI